jgi:phosphoenolpyruvate-protein kinase (PTS system EI component)
MELIEVVDKEKENTQKKLEKVLEGIARQEEKDKGVSAEPDKTNQEKEKLQTTLHALKEEIEAIKQKEHVLETEKLLIEMMDVQRTQADLELTKILFKEIKDQKTEELKKWEDKRNMFANKESNMFTKGLSNRVKRLQNDIATETAVLYKTKSRKKDVIRFISLNKIFVNSKSACALWTSIISINNFSVSNTCSFCFIASTSKDIKKCKNYTR